MQQPGGERMSESQVKGRFPAAAALLERASPDILAFTGLSKDARARRMSVPAGAHGHEG